MKIMLKIIYRICFATKYYFFFEIQPRRLFNFSWILYYFIFTLARCWRFYLYEYYWTKSMKSNTRNVKLTPVDKRCSYQILNS